MTKPMKESDNRCPQNRRDEKRNRAGGPGLRMTSFT